jgi:glutamyl-tRNA reductase
MTDPDSIPIAVAGVSHHTANITALEAFRFAGEAEFLASASAHFKGVLLLQTCNRVEVIVEGTAGELREFLTG